ncbi:MAG: hypothetical protein H7325_13115 [Pedobacter sp.]|nr:hypothetical protein [Pedobacter sp.]
MVVKQYPGDRTILTNYPDMGKVNPSEAQLIAKLNFAEAIAYARKLSIMERKNY